MKSRGYGSLLKQKIIETYPEYLHKFPNYRYALDIMETVFNATKPSKALVISTYDDLIKKAINTPPEHVIEIIPTTPTTPTILSWNSDYYFDNFYLWADFSKTDRKTVTALELLAEATALLKLFLSTRLHLILYDLTNYYDLTIIEALKLKQTFPITQLMNRIRDYLQIPIIKYKNIEPFTEDLEEMKEKVKASPENPRVKKYQTQIQTFQAKTGIQLTTDEKIEFIAEKLLDELVQEDYDEIES
jgi:hypothetical protein